MGTALQMCFDFGEVACDEAGLDPSGSARLELMVSDPTVPAPRTSRAIALEIARALKMMRGNGENRRRVPQRLLNARVQTLRQLQRSVIDGEYCGERDTLNVDGAKFQFVLKRTAELFQRALRDAGLDTAGADHVMATFECLLEERAADLQKELADMPLPTVD